VVYSVDSSRHSFLGKTYLLRELRVDMKRIQAPIIAGLLLLMLMLPQLALANPAAIILSQASGYCGGSINATATVDLAGTYRICWNSRTPDNVKGTFTTTGAANYTVGFLIPETVKGTYAVYLTREDYSPLATSNFTVVPFVKIDPEEGPVGTQVTFSGNGFAASQDIQVSFLGTASTGQANTVGNWTLNYTIPATPASGYTFEVEFKEGTVWYDLVGKYFEVTPKITAPSVGRVGETIQVKGTGFGSKEENIKVIFRRQGTTVDVVAKDTIPADEDGSWEATVVVPAVQGGSYAIDASGPLTKAGDVPDVSFTLGAGILVEPSSAYVGDTITVTGGGFASGETGIRVTFDGQVAATLTARTNGTWESSFALPPSAYGSHTVSASGDVTKPAVTATFSTRARIEAVSPVQGAPGDSVSLTGSGFSSNQALTVRVGGVAVPGNMQTLSNGNVVINFRVPKGSVRGKQTLVVTDGGGATGSADFTVIEKVLATPQPISPQKGSRSMSGQVTFRWGAITGGSNITYILQISDKPDVATYVWSKSDIETSTYTLPEEEALLKGSYYWWVRAVDDYGNESPWSDSSSFNVFLIPTWLWVVIGVVILIVLMVVAYRETKFRIAE
jgi:hypothetical protein